MPDMVAKPQNQSRTVLKESVDALVDEIVNGDDSYWQKYTERLAAERAAGFRIGLFKTWSMNNTFYLRAQQKMRQTSVKGLFAGVDQWRKKDRSIRAGEKPYIIFGPPAFRRAANPQQTPAQPAVAPAVTTGAPAPAQPQQGTLVFRRPPAIEVWDWTQTVADDPDYPEPNWAVPLAVGDLETLAHLTESAPVPVSFANIGSKDENGWLDAEGITVDDSLPIGNRISTLVHELAHHHLGHLDKLKASGSDGDVRSQCEQEAGLAQFLAMKMLGLDEGVGNEVTKDAGAYLRAWTRVTAEGDTVPVEGHKTKRKLILSRLNTAFKAADAIVSAYAETLPANVAQAEVAAA